MNAINRNNRCRNAFYKVSFMIYMLLLALPQSIKAQEYVEKRIVKSELKRDEMHIRFRVSEDRIDSTYMNNADSLRRIVEWVDQVQRDSMVDIVSVEFCGAVSPEGSVRINRYLSNARLRALEKYVRSRIYIPEDIIVRNDHYIAWNELYDMVVNSDLEDKDKILEILTSENVSEPGKIDSRIGELKRFDNGKTWKRLFDMFFVDMRNAYTILVTKKSRIAIEYELRQQRKQLVIPPVDFNHIPTLAQASPALEPPEEPGTEYRNVYIKTNVAGLALLMANLGVEFDLGRYFSLNIPVYYSAVNYFCPTLKFRNFTLQPELRYWPKRNGRGFFVGAHAGFSYYNFAFNGDWRYQDHDGKSPTLGGGLSLGYRLPISHNDRWNLEFSVGAGAYPLHYDKFHNEMNGAIYSTHRKTYVGLDNVQIGISYRIPMKEVELKTSR